jgi:hypothetical protein
MFEKEAEESFMCKKVLYKWETDKRSYIDGFQDGAKFGYNKANEWHYIKDELPPENVPLNIITFDKNKKRRLWEGEYKGGNGQWWTGYFNHFIDVPYAWKEIVLPKEIE